MAALFHPPSAMIHEVLLAILRQRGASAASEAVVADYLRLPDRHRSGRGMTAERFVVEQLAADAGIEETQADTLLRSLAKNFNGINNILG